MEGRLLLFDVMKYGMAHRKTAQRSELPGVWSWKQVVSSSLPPCSQDCSSVASAGSARAINHSDLFSLYITDKYFIDSEFRFFALAYGKSDL